MPYNACNNKRPLYPIHLHTFMSTAVLFSSQTQISIGQKWYYPVCFVCMSVAGDLWPALSLRRAALLLDMNQGTAYNERAGRLSLPLISMAHYWLWMRCRFSACSLWVISGWVSSPGLPHKCRVMQPAPLSVTHPVTVWNWGKITERRKKFSGGTHQA